MYIAEELTQGNYDNKDIYVDLGVDKYNELVSRILKNRASSPLLLTLPCQDLLWARRDFISALKHVTHASNKLATRHVFSRQL